MTLREMKFVGVLPACLLALVAALILLGGAYAERYYPPTAPTVADQPPEVLRRLEITLRGDIDKTHPAVGGERYRKFECREVPRKRLDSAVTEKGPAKPWPPNAPSSSVTP